MELAAAYKRVVHWRRHLFNVPFGSSGRLFVEKLAAIIQSFCDSTRWREVGWKARCVSCHVLLQKPSTEGSNSSHTKHLERCFSLWKAGQLSELMEESLSIQSYLRISLRNSRKDAASKGPSEKVFASLVYNGKIHSTVR